MYPDHPASKLADVDNGVNRQWLLASRPVGMIDPSSFGLREAPMPEPGDGEFLVQNLYLDLSPAMRLWVADRGWQNDLVQYFPPVEIGEVMRGPSVARVVESAHPNYAAGDLVSGWFGWQEYAASDGAGPLPATKLPPGVPPSWAVGVLGGATLTAYFGLETVAKPQAGETVVVSGAAGATGSMVGQIAKLRGARVVGIAGSATKCHWLRDELGFDETIDYKSDDVATRLSQLCPRGLDVFWDNVGGEVLDAALCNLALKARVVICGGTSGYNASEPPAGPRNYGRLVIGRARMEGFLVFDHLDRVDEAISELLPWISEGRLRCREEVRDGLESAPAALVDLFRGRNMGKLVVRVANERPAKPGNREEGDYVSSDDRAY